MNLLETKLEERGIKITAIRLLILRAMMDFKSAFTLGDLENALETVDKSTLFRAITLFHGKHLIHSIDDGSGSIKYAICSSDCMCSVQDLHLHFFCAACRRTFCLDKIHIPQIELPENYQLSSINFVLKGICANCKSDNRPLR